MKYRTSLGWCILFVLVFVVSCAPLRKTKIGLMVYEDDDHGQFLTCIAKAKVQMLNEQLPYPNVELELEDVEYDERSSIKAYQVAKKFMDGENGGVDVIIGPSTSHQSEIVSGVVKLVPSLKCSEDPALLTTKVVPNVAFHSTSSIFDQRDEHYYFFKPYHNNQDMGQAWVLLMKHYKWTQCALISTLDPYGVSAASEFAKAARSRNITVFQVFYPEGDSQNLEASLRNIKNRGHRIIYPTITELETPSLLKTAAELDMVNDKYVWLFTESTARWIYYDCGWSKCKRTCTSDESSCSASRSQKCVIDFNSCKDIIDTEKIHCTLPVASFIISPGSGHGQKWRDFVSYYNNEFVDPDCPVEEGDISVYNLNHNFLGEYLIDALEGIANAYNNETNYCEAVSCEEVEQRNACSDMLSGDYAGSTGIVNMDKKRSIFYDIINLNYTTSGENTFVEFNYIGTWSNLSMINFDWTDIPSDDYKKGLYYSCSDDDLESIVTLDDACGSDRESLLKYKESCIESIRVSFKQPGHVEASSFICSCHFDDDGNLDQVIVLRSEAVFLGGSTFAPLDGNQRELQYIFWDGALAVTISVFIGIILSICSLTAAVILKYQRTPIIAHSTPIFLLTVLTGLSMLTLSLHGWIGKPQPFSCNFRIWLGFIGQALILFPILSKAWRVWRMFKPRKKVRTSVMTNREFIKYNGILLIIPVVLLIIWTAAATSDFGVTLTADTTKAYATCTNGFTFLLVLLVYFFAIEIVCCVVTFQIRSYDTGFKESYYLNLITGNILFTSVVGVIVGFVLTENYIGVFVCACLSILTTWCLLYIPKLYIMLFKKDRNVTPPEHDLTIDVMNKEGEVDNYYSRLKGIQKK